MPYYYIARHNGKSCVSVLNFMGYLAYRAYWWKRQKAVNKRKLKRRHK